VKCDCNKGWEGRGCERKVEEDEEIRGAQKCAQQKIFNISVEIVRTYSSEDLKRLQKEIRYFWNIACNCSLISLLQRSKSKVKITFFSSGLLIIHRYSWKVLSAFKLYNLFKLKFLT
jgi:hypothetical protein